VSPLQGVSFAIEPGEFFVLVGPSGSGKSTLLRMIAGLEEVTSGTLLFNETEMNTVPSRDRDVGMVFQNYALYPHLTVRENLAFPLSIRKQDQAEIKKRVNETAELLQLTRELDRKPKQLSGGQRQRVAVGRAIIRKPRVFLFDEPLSNLDAQLRTHMRTELKVLQRELGVTTVYVTHDQVEAMTMSDRMAILNNGTLQQVGTPQEIYDHPANAFVAGFTGSPPMNLLPAKLIQATAEQHHLIGIRPEHLQAAQGTPPTDSQVQLAVNVQTVEFLGHEWLTHATLGGHNIIRRSPDRGTDEPGQTSTWTSDLEDLRLFAE
jgi:ABC-type sugar transport system ATPase subunit